MNWNDPHLRLSLKDWEETLNARGRDSRIVRAVFAYSRRKKECLNALRQFWLGWCDRPLQEPSRLRVFFWLPGGLGDAACARRLVSAYRKLLPGARFEIYCPLPGVSEALFAADADTVCLPRNRVCWKHCDLAVWACLFVKFLYADEKRLKSLSPAFWPVFKRARAAQENLRAFLEDPFLTESVLGRWLASNGGRRFDLLSYTGGTDLSHDAQEPFPADAFRSGLFGLKDKTYVTFHDGTSEAQKLSSSCPTRAWPRENWREFIRLFKKKYPHTLLVQLGGANSRTYEEADVCLLGKTRLSDLPGLLEGASAHVDTESGLVHLAQYVNVRSVVLFGPSDVRFFGYAKNKNLSAGDCGGCMWTTPDWMQCCPVGKTRNSCMAAVAPQRVLEAVGEILRR